MKRSNLNGHRTNFLDGHSRRTGQAAIEMVMLVVLIGSVILWAVLSWMPQLATALAPLGDQATPLTIDDRPAAAAHPSPAKWILALSAPFLLAIVVWIFFRKANVNSASPRPGEERDWMNELHDQVQIRKSFESARLFEKREDLFRRLIERAGSHSEATVEDIMTRHPVCIAPDANSDAARAMMERFHFRHLMVVGADQQLVGVLSDRDIADNRDAPVGRLMTAHPITVDQHRSVNAAVSVMLQHRISCLPVLHAGKLAGVISLSDVAISLQCLLLIFDDIFSVMLENQCLVPDVIRHRRQTGPQA